MNCIRYMSLHCLLDLEDGNPFFFFSFFLFFAWHSSLWWCITITSLFTNGSDIQKISSSQTLTEILNIPCGFHHSNPVFPLDTLAYEQTRFDCKQIISSKATVETVIFWLYISPHCHLDLDDTNPIFSHENPAHYQAPPYQVWLWNVQQFRRHLQDSAVQTDTVIPA